MMLAHDDLLAISQLFDEKLLPINQRLDSMDVRLGSMDKRLDSMDKRFDSVENRIGILEFKQNRTTKKLDDLAFSMQVFERNTRHDIHILQDEMETVIEVLKQQNLIAQ